MPGFKSRWAGPMGLCNTAEEYDDMSLNKRLGFPTLSRRMVCQQYVVA